MMQRIRIEWGGLTSYVDNNLPDICWDGGVTVTDGKLRSLAVLEFGSKGHFFQGHRRLPLEGSTWRSRTNQSLEGVLMEVTGTDATRITVHTIPKTVTFTLGDLLAKRFISWPVGAKYAGWSLAVMLEGAGPFERDTCVGPDCLDVRLGPAAFSGAGKHALFLDYDAVWIRPGAAVEAEITLPRAPWREAARRSALTLELRLALTQNWEEPGLKSTRYSPVIVEVNGRKVFAAPVYFRSEWAYWMEYLPIPVPPDALQAGTNRIAVRNAAAADNLIVYSAQLREVLEEDFEIAAAPRWLLAGDRFDLVLRCLQPHAGVTCQCTGGSARCAPRDAFEPGLHRLAFVAGSGPQSMTVTLVSGALRREVVIPVFALVRETPSWKVGGVLQNLNHDEASGAVTAAIDYCRDTQMGNYVQFRPEPSCNERSNWDAVTMEQMRRWGEQLKSREMYFAFISGHAWEGYQRYLEKFGPDPKTYEACRMLKNIAGEYFFAAHVHEYSRRIYGQLPGMDEEPWTMRSAREQYVRELAGLRLIEDVPRQIGESAALMSYACESGMDYIAVETMALNNMHLFAAARGAARAYKKSVWGSHNATYWVKAPDDFTKMTLNWLNFYMTYAAGGNFAISEDGHFCIAHAHHQYGFTGEPTERLREIIRRFYRFVNTHPRRGEPEVNLAVAQGLNSCEIAAFPINCLWVRGAAGRVWGGLGSKRAPEKWRYGDPERGLVLMDELMPYWQDGVHFRHWFTGTPYGQFDFTPLWKADSAMLARYRVLVVLGWNTMTPEIYAKLRDYVRQGGTLFMAVPQLTQHEDRAFLQTMTDLHLIHAGDWRDLFGLRVLGPAEPQGTLTADWTAEAASAGFPVGKQYTVKEAKPGPRLARLADITARVLLRERESGQPVLTEHRLGHGRACLLTTWAYPGRPCWEPVVRDILAGLGRQSLDAVRLEDPSRDVAWYVWRDESGLRNIYLLNTDWTVAGNVKPCRLRLGDASFLLEVPEGRCTTVTWRGDLAVYPCQDETYVEDVVAGSGAAPARIIAHGTGRTELVVQALRGRLREIRINDGGSADCRFSDDRTRAKITLDFQRASRAELMVQAI